MAVCSLQHQRQVWTFVAQLGQATGLRCARGSARALQLSQRALQTSARLRARHAHPDEAESGPSSVTINDERRIPSGAEVKARAAAQPRPFATEDFFTPGKHVPANNERTDEVSAKALERLLEICNSATLHARDSAAPEHLFKIRQMLQEAAKVYMQIIESGNVRHTMDVYYESYLIRSTYLSIIRTVAAVNGLQSIGVYTRMMCDHLHLEKQLYDRGIESLKSAPEPFDKAEVTGKQLTRSRDMRMVPQKDLPYLEWAFFQTPLPQDATPTVFDIFSDFAAASWSENQALQRNDGDTYHELARALLDAIRQLPIEFWARPVTPDWIKFRSRRMPKSETGAQLIISCQQMLIRKMADVGMLQAAYQEYRCALDYSSTVSTLSKASGNLVALLDKRRLQLERGTTMSDDPGALLQEYLAMLHNIMLDLKDGGRPAGVPPRYVAVERWSLVLVCVLRLDRLPLHLKKGAQARSRDIKVLFEQFVEALSAGELKHLHEGLSMDDVRERIVEALASGYASKDGMTSESILQYLSFLSSNADVASPSDRTCLTLLRASRGRLWPSLFEAALQTLYVNAQHTLRNELKMVRSVPHSLRGRLAWILEAAVLQNDSDKIVAILQGLARVFSSHRLRLMESGQSSRDAKALFKSIGATPTELILLLYPSLDIRFKRGIHKQKKRRAARRLNTDGIKHPTAPFTAPVLLASLTMTMRLGRTGLAERIWLLIRRVQRVMERYRSQGHAPFMARQGAEEGGEQGNRLSRREGRALFFRTALQAIPVSAYTTMLKVYAIEVEKSLRAARSRTSRLATSRPSTRLALGFGHRLGADPYSPRAPQRPILAAEAARNNAQACYLELRQSWAEAIEDAEGEAKGARRLARPDAALFRALFGSWRRKPQFHRSVVKLSSWRGTEQGPFLQLVRQDMARFGITEKECNVRYWDNILHADS